MNVDTPVIFKSANVDRPEEFTFPVTLPVKFLTIGSGSLARFIVPVVMFAAFDKLLAVVAVPVKFPITVVAVKVPRNVELCSVSRIFELV